MGKVISVMARPVKRFNIDNRAERVISKTKPTPAPQYPQTIKQLKLAQQHDPHFMETHNKKNELLDDHLKKIYVTSKDPMPEVDYESSRKLLPKHHQYERVSDYGYEESLKVPIGKCSLKQAIIFLTHHDNDSKINNSESIAAHYKLEKKDVDNILSYYKIFRVQAPKGHTEKEYEEHASLTRAIDNK